MTQPGIASAAGKAPRIFKPSGAGIESKHLQISGDKKLEVRRHDLALGVGTAKLNRGRRGGWGVGYRLVCSTGLSGWPAPVGFTHRD
jgi:hypothetical protein